MRKSKYSVEVGDIFGKLTVISKTSDGVYYCECDCGNTIDIYARQLITKNTTKCNIKCGIRPIIIGERFGKLIVQTPVKSDKRGRWVECVCDCGNTIITIFHTLFGGICKSCGCTRKSKLVARNKATSTHNMSRTPTYNTWFGIKDRCDNSNSPSYPNYGGRGIIVCDRWCDSFEMFLEDMGIKPEGTSIDRINVNGNYEPENCRWATPAQQCRNQRSNVLDEVDAMQIRWIVLDNKQKIGAVAKAWNIHNSHVSQIISNKLWKVSAE